MCPYCAGKLVLEAEEPVIVTYIDLSTAQSFEVEETEAIYTCTKCGRVWDESEIL